jgi:hypothetical protein
MRKNLLVAVFLVFTVLFVCIGGISAADNVSDNQPATDNNSGSVASEPTVVSSEDNVVSQENSISDNNQVIVGQSSSNNSSVLANMGGFIYYNISKITNNRTVVKGEDVSFDIIITFTGVFDGDGNSVDYPYPISGLLIQEVQYDDLIFKSWEPLTGNWTFSQYDGEDFIIDNYTVYNGTYRWILESDLYYNESASFRVVFSTENCTYGIKTNVVLGGYYLNFTSNTTEVIENTTNTTNSTNITNTTVNNETNNTNTTNTTNTTSYDNFTKSDKLKADVKTATDTGYPFVALIIALIAILGTGSRKR